MKKTIKKSPSKAAHKKAVKDLDVKPAKGGTVRGGVSKVDKSSPVLFLNCATGKHY